MLFLLLGVALWTGAHFWKRILPAQHAAMGKRAKGLSTLGIFASIGFMIVGYKMTDTPDWGTIMPLVKHLSLLLIVVGFYFMTPGPKKGALFYKMRHPMLTGFILWTVAHLLLNPDVGSWIMFGGLLVWAYGSIFLINSQDGAWTPNPKGSLAKDAMFFAIAIVSVLIIGVIHGMIGPSVFGA